MSGSDWGTRGRICLICRTAVPMDGPLDCCRYATVIPLADPAYRRKCERTIHGPPALWYDALTLLRRWWRRGKTPPSPDRFATPRPGTIGACTVAPPPFGGYLSCAYGVTVSDRVRVVLHDAWSLGFTIDLDDGRRAEVPAGRVVVDTRGGVMLRSDGEAAYFRDVIGAPEPEPFRVHTIRVRWFRPGDRVALCGEVADAGGLREAPHLIPIGVPLLSAPAC